MKQRWLPGFDGPDAEEPLVPPPTEEPVPTPFEVRPLPGQIRLFSRERELLGILEAAMAEGRFEEAHTYRDTLAAGGRSSRANEDLRVLDRLADAAFWSQGIGACVQEWATLDAGWRGSSSHRWLVKRGFFRRMCLAHGPLALVRSAPALLPALLAFLTESQGALPTAANELLRDALLAGILAPPGAVADRELADLLSEDRPPEWLACIGALRWLWPVPDATGPIAEVSSDALPPVPVEDGERGRQFWQCLQLALWRPRDDVIATEARKRMKRLDPDLHAQFMRQGARRD